MAARDAFALKDLKEYEGAHCYHHLIDISQSNRDKVKMEENLVRQVNDAIHMIEEQSGREIELMYIGKTYAGKKVRQPFNRLDPETWIKDGIKARWEDHRSEKEDKRAKRNADHAKDGMVVLCVFTQDDLPAGSRRSQEFLALAMEERLIHHFQIFDARKILINKTFDEGSISIHTKSFSELSISVYSDNSELDLTRSIPKPNHYAAVLYMTFAFLPPESEWDNLREKQKTALDEQREREKRKKEEKERKEREERERKEKEEKEKKEQEEKDKKQKGKKPKKKAVKAASADTEEGSSSEASQKEEGSISEASSIREENSPLFSSTPVLPVNALSSKENIPPFPGVKKDLLSALEEATEL